MRILSGIQPSGVFHIGNYFGMMKKMIEYQENHDLFAFIANLHAMTSQTEGSVLKENTLEAAASFLALGLDPGKSVFWVQSDVAEVTELTWILSTVTSMGLLERCHSYKDKIAKGIPASHALFAYPVLMTADILIFQSERVPVGKDQKQHLEVARDIADRFNLAFGDTFVVPEPEIDDQVAVVPGIDGQKMSKTYKNTIDIFCEKKAMKKQVMSIVTDSSPVEAPKDPDTCNLFAIASLFLADSERQELARQYRAGGLKYGEVKKDLVERIWSFFSSFRQQREDLLSDRERLGKILSDGAEKARAVAVETMQEVRTRTGLKYLTD